jgi:hypothetical protein
MATATKEPSGDVLDRFKKILAKGGRPAKKLQARLERLEQSEKDGRDFVTETLEEIGDLEKKLSRAEADHSNLSKQAADAKKKANKYRDELRGKARSVRGGQIQPSLFPGGTNGEPPKGKRGRPAKGKATVNAESNGHSAKSSLGVHASLNGKPKRQRKVTGPKNVGKGIVNRVKSVKKTFA